jgi:hypothetical protein
MPRIDVSAQMRDPMVEPVTGGAAKQGRMQQGEFDEGKPERDAECHVGGTFQHHDYGTNARVAKLQSNALLAATFALLPFSALIGPAEAFTSRDGSEVARIRSV